MIFSADKFVWTKSENKFNQCGIHFINMYDKNQFTDISKNSNYHDLSGHFIISAKHRYTKILCDYLKQVSNWL